jgi:large subunit ribosomal protein L24
MLRRIRKDDTVMVMRGRARGKTGKVLRIVTEKSRVYVEQVNMIKRHRKPRSTTDAGGIIEREASIHLSNVMPICGQCDKPTRIVRKALEHGGSVRICRRCGQQMDGV